MTIKEAFDELKSLHYDKHELFANDDNAWSVVFEAIDKQIPMKPELDDDGDYLCTRCYHMVGNVIDDPQKYCKECGQKLDWSISQNHCRFCKWYKKIEQCGETYTVCWLPFKKNPNGVNTVSAINDDDKVCSEFERKKNDGEKEQEC